MTTESTNKLNTHRRGETPPQVIAVTGGKGGIGKTTISINLAVALAVAGKRVLLLDADLGLANVDVLLNLKADRNLSHVLAGECALEDVLLHGPAGIRVVPAASGVRAMSELCDRQRAGLIHAFSDLAHEADVLLIDTAAGIAGNTVTFCGAAQEIVIVVCNDPASIADAYATIKVLHQADGRQRFRVVVNMARDLAEGREVFNKLAAVADRFLDVTLEASGTIVLDQRASDAARARVPLVQKFPSSPAALAFKKLARATDNWPNPSTARGTLEFFVEHLVHAPSQGRRARA